MANDFCKEDRQIANKHKKRKREMKGEERGEEI